MNDAHVVLRGAHIARILKGDPRVASLEEHREHLLPHFERRDDLAENLTFARHLFVRFVATFEFCAIGLMEIGYLIRVEECPIAA